MFSKAKFHSGAKILLTGCAFLAFSSAAWADQTHVSYNLVSGATLTVSVPATNMPVSFTCANITPGYRGVGQATLQRALPQSFIEWVGTDAATSTISAGFSSTPGTHIVYCSYTDKYVDVQVLNATQIQIKNTSTSTTMTGVINFVW